MKNLFDTCKCNAYLVDYRGFGLSSSEPNEIGNYGFLIFFYYERTTQL
jgi:hypothetical protein